ncbi:hypothetical protein C7I84_21455 [Mesorhizobium ephedrae]|uniref:Uncharacterized protein n=1 Tax=Kumtagia ephedrae TaxID=2116701 RepID=A0A2P7S0Z2_9HYPH|nr:hypothetical protein C7I84_21455 [Mesorhizobium ephedrae]
MQGVWATKADRKTRFISDFTPNLIMDYLCSYTEAFAVAHIFTVRLRGSPSIRCWCANPSRGGNREGSDDAGLPGQPASVIDHTTRT